MADQESFQNELIGKTLLVRFIQPSLVFPDQVRAVENVLTSPAEQIAPPVVVLDCGQVDHISSAGWAEIIRLNKILNRDERKLRICNLNPVPREVFDMMKLGEVLDLRASTEEALDNNGP